MHLYKKINKKYAVVVLSNGESNKILSTKLFMIEISF